MFDKFTEKLQEQKDKKTINNVVFLKHWDHMLEIAQEVVAEANMQISPRTGDSYSVSMAGDEQFQEHWICINKNGKSFLCIFIRTGNGWTTTGSTVPFREMEVVDGTMCKKVGVHFQKLTWPDFSAYVKSSIVSAMEKNIGREHGII